METSEPWRDIKAVYSEQIGGNEENILKLCYSQDLKNEHGTPFFFFSSFLIQNTKHRLVKTLELVIPEIRKALSFSIAEREVTSALGQLLLERIKARIKAHYLAEVYWIS